VNIDREENEDRDTVNADETGNPLSDVSLKGIPDQSGYVNIEVEVAAKTTLSNGVVELTVQDDTGARDIIVKDRENDEMDVADGVNYGDLVRFEWVKPGKDLKVRAKTTATVLDQSTPTSNDSGDDTGAGTVEGGQGAQDAARADGGSDAEVDTDLVRNIIGAQQNRDDITGAPVEEVLNAAEERGCGRGVARRCHQRPRCMHVGLPISPDSVHRFGCAVAPLAEGATAAKGLVIK
jgi:hypothetical protein